MKTAPAPEGAKHQNQNQYSNTLSDNPAVKRKLQDNAGGYAERMDAIRFALLEHGIEATNMDALLSRLGDTEGKQIRFSPASKPRKKNGSAIAYHDRGLPFVVLATDWATGAEMKWVAFDAETLTPEKQEQQKQGQ